MKNVGFSQWLETIGVIAIVISLVLVAIEIQQNTNATAAQAFMALTQEHNENDRSVINDPDLADMLGRAEADLRRAEGEASFLSASDIIRMERLIRSRFTVREAAYVFHKRGLLDESEYSPWREGICEELGHPGMRAYWNRNPTSWNAEFMRDADTRCQ